MPESHKSGTEPKLDKLDEPIIDEVVTVEFGKETPKLVAIPVDQIVLNYPKGHPKFSKGKDLSDIGIKHGERKEEYKKEKLPKPRLFL